ncbi:unnamed protein product [Adineta ricciae]|uniref:Uncharacterized protein n=1 Tax=Adineta ricciae TaxID=249248 RepID=A0A815D875_ADIRI|nr:unnamed protein product [Adineta ricciae]
MLIASESQYHLYYTDSTCESDLYYDCLHYKVPDGVFPPHPHQIIPYCIRPLITTEKQPSTNVTSHSSLSFRFETLKNLNVNTQDLLTWSAPVDLVERYQSYLDSSRLNSTAEFFYNCTSPWFGPFCQYTFDSDESFEVIVRKTFLAKQKKDTDSLSVSDITNLTCYVHLDCNRGVSPICLDWREVCNGHMDCLDTGIDEKDCLQLEINECEPNEYRCYNGMCVDQQFIDDDMANPDCLDGTDENDLLKQDLQRYLGFAGCAADPAFRCEDSNQFFWQSRFCVRRRAANFVWSVFRDGQDFSNLTFDCRTVMNCIASEIHGIPCIKALCGSHGLPCNISLQKVCNQSKYAMLPAFPTIENYAQFGYWTNKAITFDLFGRIPFPDFVCYNPQRCPFMLPQFHLNNLSCSGLANAALSEIRRVIMIVQTCLSFDQVANESHCLNQQLFQCSNTAKCISKHRLLDGVYDCPWIDDERYNRSCALNHRHRFRCSAKENKCYSPIVIYYSKDGCHDSDDERLRLKQKVPFQHLCDKHTHLPSANETDETNCEQFPCDNQYTRCDRIWNCDNGADEVNCDPTSRCYPDRHECISHDTFEVMCLSMNRTGDGKIDCLGATDEREHCRRQEAKKNRFRYRCWNDTLCTLSQCSSLDDCPYEQNQFAKEKCEKNPHIEKILKSVGSDYFLGNPLSLSYKHFELGNETRFQFNRSLIPLIMPQTSTPISSAHMPRMETDYPLQIDFRRAWICNRGLLVFRGGNKEEYCLCPPSYYGRRCEFQNQRVSLTLRFTKECQPSCLGVYGIVLRLIDHEQHIHSYEQLTYISIFNCTMKYNIYLLYRSRLKNLTMNYTIRIDAYNKINLMYHASWILPIKFLFLPVNRITTSLIIPSQPLGLHSNCQFICGDHGRCTAYVNTGQSFCLCESGWSGPNCAIRLVNCTCSTESICLGRVHHRSICLCSQNHAGPRCLLHSVCQMNPCKNGGQCVPEDDRISMNNFTCICITGYSGTTCDVRNTRIEIFFTNVRIPPSLQVHFVTTQFKNDPLVTTISKKVAFDQNSAVLYTTELFNIIFVEVHAEFYLTYLQVDPLPSISITLEMKSDQRCSSVHNLFDEQTLAFPLLRRAKYYHVLCQKYPRLTCLYDKEMFMCLCNEDNYANCFPVNMSKSSVCQGRTTCENGGQCLVDRAICPISTLCICADCFFGGRCQFTTKDFSLSLDVILGYQIRQYVSITRQSIAVKISFAVTTLVLVIGLINATLSIKTFRLENISNVGCGLYLLTLSIISLLSIIALTLKFWLLICFQALWITNRSILLVNCISSEYILRSLLAIEDWLSACVAIERVFVAIKGVSFDRRKSKGIARWVIAGVILSTLLSFVYESIHRELVDDEEEQRTWCMARYPPPMKHVDSALHTFHFVVPFSVNLVAAALIIVIIARAHSTAHKQKTYQEHLHEEFHRQKHLIISPITLVILALPRLVISFLSGCMKSMREPWLFLTGYFISFLPSVLTFVVFIWPSTTYKQEFKGMIKRHQIAMRQRFFPK